MPELRDRCLDDGQGALRQGRVCGGHDRAPAGLLDNRAGRLEALRTAARQYEVCRCFGSALANATPRPEEAPVTIATLSSRRKRSSTGGHVCPSGRSGRQL
jgi:hypothetical protein